MKVDHLAEGVTLYGGDCLDRLRELPDCSIDACVTDPPYGLGFMGKAWDSPETIAFRRETWAEVMRVLKPGGHVIAASGTRTYHRLAVAIEDAGFEIRDQLLWLFGQGFPKSRNLDGEWQGWGTALKPACEPWVLARKPLSGTVATNVLAHGTGALNIDGCRIEGVKPQVTQGVNSNATSFNVAKERRLSGDPNEGRWPANVIHDGSDEVVEAFPTTTSTPPGNIKPSPTTANAYGEFAARSLIGHTDSGSAARFFYSAKADADDRLGSKHPTVKPVDLMQYLVRLVTPKGGIVLDPFAGTGTTGEACIREGMRAILIEREPEYQADIRKRMKLAMAGPDTRKHARIKQAPVETLPLFGA